MIAAESTRSGPKVGEGRFARFDPSVGGNWLLLIAIHPLVRVLILSDSSAELAGVRVAESFLWFSFWLVEGAIIATAVRTGFRVMPCLGALGRPAGVLLAVWFGAVVIATVNAAFLQPAVRSAATWLAHGLFAMAVWHLAMRDREQFERAFDRFAIALAWATAIAGTVAVAAIYSIGLSSGHPFASDTPGFSHVRHSGYIFAPAMAVCLGRLATAPERPWIPTLLFAANLALCLWFGSRGPVFGLIAGLAVCCALFAEFRRRTFWARAGAAMAAGSILSVAVPSPEGAAFNALRRFFMGWDGSHEFTSGRTEFWKDAARLIVDRPLFGYGGEQFQYVSPVAAWTYRHPHDFFLQVIFDWGMIGGGAFLALLALGAGIVLKLRREASAAGRVAAFGAVCMLGYATLDGILFYPFTIGVTVLFMVAALALTRAEAVTGNSSVRLGALSAT